MEKCAPQNGLFLSVLWYLLVTLLLLCNSLSAICRLVYHEVWTRSHPFLQTDKELLPFNFSYTRHCSLFQSTFLCFWLGPWYRFHCLRNLLESSINSAPVQIFILVSLLHIPLLLPAPFSCTPLLAKPFCYPMLHPPRPTPIPRHLPSLLSSPQYVLLSCN